jgi:hypothetical protein
MRIARRSLLRSVHSQTCMLGLGVYLYAYPFVYSLLRIGVLIPWQNSERSKVIQSIASVIQALPPDEEIPPIEV